MNIKRETIRNVGLMDQCFDCKNLIFDFHKKKRKNTKFKAFD